MEFKLIETSAIVYRAIYEQHRDELVVFGSYTEMDDHGDKLRAQMTDWGFKGAEHPIIRSVMRDYNVWKYYILETAFSED